MFLTLVPAASSKDPMATLPILLKVWFMLTLHSSASWLY